MPSSLSAETIAELVLTRVAATPGAPAFKYLEAGGAGSWKTITWAEVGDRVRSIASGLRALGLADEQRCAILSSTRVEWILADFGILTAGGATTTIYPGNTPDECAYITADSDTVFVFAENDSQAQKLVQRREAVPGLKHIIVFEGTASPDGFILTLAQLEERGRAYATAHPGEFEKTARAVTRDRLATLVYTSGTTGKPKGVELTHDAWIFEGEAVDALGFLRFDDIHYLWLPLAHVFGKALEMAQLRVGFLTAIDGRVDKMVENLAVIQPTFVAAVPRIFEKIYNAVLQRAKTQGALKYRVFRWAISVGLEASRLVQEGKTPGPLLALKRRVADRAVFTAVRARFGGRLRFFVSGSAPLSRELAEFFHACGLLILEGYGLTETSAGAFLNKPQKFKFGTVGPPLPGVEVKILESDGEVLVRGRGNMRGYHGLPEETREAIDPEGWLHTGDIGELDDGCLRITDRKKDLIKTSGGKYVAPQMVEGKFQLACRYASQSVVHGNNRNFVVMLVALDETEIKRWAKANALETLSYSELTRHEKVLALVQGCVDELNKGLAGYESVRKFAILPVDLSLEAGDLTPSLKLKRKVVETKYRDLLEGFYSGAVQKV